jgi:hypothetical protein
MDSTLRAVPHNLKEGPITRLIKLFYSFKCNKSLLQRILKLIYNTSF